MNDKEILNQKIAEAYDKYKRVVWGIKDRDAAIRVALKEYEDKTYPPRPTSPSV